MLAQTRSALLKVIVLMFWVLFVRVFLVWSCTSISYLGNYLLQVLIIIALRDCTTNWSYQESYRSIVLNSYLRMFFSLPYVYFFGKMILEIFEIYHQEINPSTSCPWTIGIILCGRSCRSSLLWRWFHLLYSFPRMRFVLTPMCLPCILWILLIYLILFWCFN